MLHTASAGDVALSAAFASRIGTWILWQRSKISSLQFYSVRRRILVHGEHQRAGRFQRRGSCDTRYSESL